MTKYIIKFSKSPAVKFVSHLDTVRVFARAMRRMGVKLSHSQGFNPHPLMTFAHPMGVGMSSSCEYVEISLDEDISSDDLMTMLNESLPAGFKAAAVKVNTEKSPFKALTYAEYSVIIKGKNSASVTELMDRPQILMDKKTKSGIKETDIKPMIHTVEETAKEEEETELRAILKCGGENLKPELMLAAAEKYIGITMEDYIIHRTGLMDESLNPLVYFGQNI